MTHDVVTERALGDYTVTRSVPTRWSDADIFGHINTSVYVQLFDTVINGWLVDHADYAPHSAQVISVVARHDVRYHSEVHFPEVLTVGVRVDAIGRSSVTYEAALFGAPGSGVHAPRLAAVTRCVHVCIDRDSRRPVEIPAPLRTLLHANR